MKPKITSFIFLILATFAQLLVPAELSAQTRAARKHPVATRLSIEPAEAKQGDTVTLTVTATVDPAYHIYAMKQPNEGGPIPTEINLDESLSAILIPVGDWKEPEGKIKFDEGFEMDVRVIYGSPLVFERQFQVAGDVGAAEVAGAFFVQACTEQSCLPPASIKFASNLTVLAGDLSKLNAATTEGSETPVVAASSTTAPAEPTAPVTIQEDLAGRTFGGFLIASFLFGILALATPCVFPMIPITVSFFTNKKTASTGAAVRNAFVYVLSIILGFTLIGFGISILLLALGGGVQNSGIQNQIAANPWVNLFFALLYMIFALSLFELFHIQLPSSFSNKLNKSALGRSDALGIAMKAMVFVLISFTCTAPLIGVLIVQTLSGEWTRPLFGMMAFATGFSLPFFVLALVPQMIGSLPKAGGWLYATKVVMGLLVFAASLKFLSNVDVAIFREDLIFTRELFLSAWIAIAAVAAFYLFGIIRLPDDDVSQGISVVRMIVGMVFATVALYLATGLGSGKLNGLIEGNLPPVFDAPTAVVNGAGGMQELTWIRDREEAFALAKKTNTPVFIDFTGYTCTNCRLMEKRMFPHPEIASRLSKYVRLKLYTDDRSKLPDGRSVGEVNQEYQANTFNTVTLPFYVVVTPDGKVLGQAEYTTNVERFTTFLDSGFPKG